MIGIGVDICSISKIEKLICQNSKFLLKYYSASEQLYLEKKNTVKWQSAAAMFAAKEAFLKALGVGLGACDMCDISLEHHDNGKPYILLYGKAKELFDAKLSKAIHVSISHEEDNAIAFLIIE